MIGPTFRGEFKNDDKREWHSQNRNWHDVLVKEEGCWDRRGVLGGFCDVDRAKVYGDLPVTIEILFEICVETFVFLYPNRLPGNMFHSSLVYKPVSGDNRGRRQASMSKPSDPQPPPTHPSNSPQWMELLGDDRGARRGGAKPANQTLGRSCCCPWCKF
jgi:hypothetical protein